MFGHMPISKGKNKKMSSMTWNVNNALLWHSHERHPHENSPNYNIYDSVRTKEYTALEFQQLLRSCSGEVSALYNILDCNKQNYTVPRWRVNAQNMILSMEWFGAKFPNVNTMDIDQLSVEWQIYNSQMRTSKLVGPHQFSRNEVWLLPSMTRQIELNINNTVCIELWEQGYNVRATESHTIKVALMIPSSNMQNYCKLCSYYYNKNNFRNYCRNSLTYLFV